MKIGIAPRICLLLCLVTPVLSGGAEAEKPHSGASWGTFLRPFSADSPWNSRPVNPSFYDNEIPASKYYPSITAGEWSTGVFSADKSDPSQVIEAYPGTAGIYMPDTGGVTEKLVIPHWPKDISPALEGDGHADLVDTDTKIIHSFYKLKRVGGKWHAALYAWSRIDGRGWGDPSHFYQGARAVGVPPMAGLIRSTEISDNEPNYTHALAMSLTYNALSAEQPYIFPATAADQNASKSNTGKIPQGALLMLPSNYPIENVKNIHLKKIIATLKIYGAYVVDRNVGTPFAIYVEKGSGFKLSPSGWDNDVAEELNRIRQSLRQVKAADKWIAGDGRVINREVSMNIMSMRGPWQLTSGAAPAKYDIYQDALLFDPQPGPKVRQVTSSNIISRVTWSAPKPGEIFELRVYARGGAKLRLLITDKSNQKIYESPEMGDGVVVPIAWPEGIGFAYLTASGPEGGVGGSVRGEMIRQASRASQ